MGVSDLDCRDLPSMPHRRLSPASCLAVFLSGLLLGCGSEAPPFAPVICGHQEVVIKEGAEPVPLIFPGKESLALCFQVDPTLDTSRWELRSSVGGRPSSEGFMPASARSGETLCFKIPLPPGLPAGRQRVCGRLVDRFDGREYRVDCQAVIYRLDDDAYRALVAARDALLGRAWELEAEELLAALDALAAEAHDAGLPMLRVQIELIAIHFLTLQSTPASRSAAGQRLKRLPEWIEKPAAYNQGAIAAYQRALLYFKSGDRLEDAWLALSRADELYRRIADSKRITVAMKEASILHEMGALDEAAYRLRAALEECEQLSCNQEIIDVAQNNFAWHVLLNPNASEEELAEAEEFIRRGLAHFSPEKKPLEHAHRLTNLAYLQVRQGENPDVLLEEMRHSLANLRLDTEFVPYLLDWADLVSAMAALASGKSAEALGICADLASRPKSQLEAWAFSCMARAHRQAGNLAAAEEAIERALLRHTYEFSQQVVRHLTIGPGYRAEEFSRAARIAIECGKPMDAWSLMLQLDQLSTDERARRRCREKATGDLLKEWLRIESEASRILDLLQELELPASERRRVEQEQMRQELKLRLQKLWRNWPGCEALPVVDDEGVDYRAFALEDEIILLHRRQGEVTVEKRTPYARQKLRRDFDQISMSLDQQEISDAAWRRLLAPLARALLPNSLDRLEPVTTYALHGLLQGIPLAMLPLSDAPDGPWLIERTAISVKPAGSRIAERRPPTGANQPLFVVDPRRNLAATPRLLRNYKELFPRARYLVGDAATLAAFQEGAPRAEWLHVDAHGLYDPAFPKLSALQLADRPLYWVQLAETPMNLRFAHLSGCQTGRWPITADSGSYGIAGLVTRLGVGWAIASRTDLDDRVAEDFNRLFYRAIADGQTVPAAYRQALRHVIELHPAGDWGGLMLLRAAGAR